MLPSHLFFPFGLVLISYTSWWVKNPNLKAQLLSDVLWLCDRTGAAASEHQNWSPNLLVSLKSRQTSCCPPAAVRGLTGLCVILLDLTGLPKPSPGCWLGTTVQFSADLCHYSNCCLQWLLLFLWRNETFSTEEWTEVRAFTFFFSSHPFLIMFPQKRCLDFKYRSVPKLLLKLS